MASKREQLRGTDANSAIDARIELGQMINQEVEAARDRKTEELIEALEPMVLAESVRAPASEFDAFNVAFLVELDRAEEFAGAVREFADESKALIETNLRGPLAAFDFIVTDDPDGS